MAMDDDIAHNVASVRQRIAAACGRAGRSPTDVTLVAVTKTVGPDRIRAAFELGLCDFGENRVQEAQGKIPALADLSIRWHMVGHLQSNKAKTAAELFHVIHSVDSLSIAQHLSRRTAATGRHLPVLLEVNVAGEASKFGFAVTDEDYREFLVQVGPMLELPGLAVEGLMTVAPLVDDPEKVRPIFRRLRGLRDLLRATWPQRRWPHLSMGMTDDFEVAIEEGATLIRLGRAIFGPRP